VTLSTFRDVPWNGPFYRKHGFRELQPAEWTPGMRAIREKEAHHGLRVHARAFMRLDLDPVDMVEPPHPRWPEHLPVGALRVVRLSPQYQQTVAFYRNLIGLPVLETFQDSYHQDGTILGQPGGTVHLEIVRQRDASPPTPGRDQLVFYLPDTPALQRIAARLAAAGIHPVPQIEYWEANGAVSFSDPDGREVVLAPWIYAPPQ
jgi:catechol 2,3-dioxygenase-like lactoylglutathione lyase family enzyme